MHLAGPWAVNAPPDRASALGVVRAAVTAGIDHIDTAQYYGPDVVNDLIREALHPYPGELAIVSKVGVFGDARAAIPHDDARQLREGIEDNLRSLRVDQLAAVNLRLPSPGRADARFDDQLAAMVQARDEGLIAGVGLSNVSLEQLRHAADGTESSACRTCSTSPTRGSAPLCRCIRRGRLRAVLPARHRAAQPIQLTSRVVIQAARLGVTRHKCAAVAAAAGAQRPAIPGTGSTGHLLESAAEHVALDDEALRDLAGVGS
jgi:hypothetical protein